MNSDGRHRGSGCLPLLGGPLLAFGVWMIAQAFLLPHEAEAIRLSVITGAFCALLGGWLLATRMGALLKRRGTPDATRAPQPRGDETASGMPRAIERLDPGIGCVVIPVGFLLFGAAMLVFYFSGTPGRGNPVMGLVGGILFTSLGLLGVWVLIRGKVDKRRGTGSRDPRRLP